MFPEGLAAFSALWIAPRVVVTGATGTAGVPFTPQSPAPTLVYLSRISGGTTLRTRIRIERA